MKKFANLVCESTAVIDGEVYQLEIVIPEGELDFEAEPDKNRVKISGYCQTVDYRIKEKVNS